MGQTNITFPEQTAREVGESLLHNPGAAAARQKYQAMGKDAIVEMLIRAEVRSYFGSFQLLTDCRVRATSSRQYRVAVASRSYMQSTLRDNHFSQNELCRHIWQQQSRR